MIVLSPNIAGTLAPHTADQSWVMFVQVNQGPIKIEGVDGDKIAARLRELARDNAHEPYLIGLVATTTPTELEAAIHAMFATDVIHHDWFEPSIELLTFVQNTCQGALQALLAQTRPGGAPSDVVDVEAMAGYLGVSVPTVRRMVKAGEIPHLRVGKALRFVVADVVASIERRGR